MITECHLKQNIIMFLTYFTALTLIYISILAIFVSPSQNTPIPSFVLLFTILIYFILTVPIIKMLAFRKLINKYVFMSSLALLCFLPRIIWITFIKTKPTSDFILYHNYAVNASKGIFTNFDITYTVFPFKFGYPLILGMIYRIFGAHVMTAKIFNVFLSFILALLIYQIGRLMFNEKTGRMGGILFCIWPSQIMYNSVIGSEHVFILFLALAVYFLLKIEKLSFNFKNILTHIFLGFSLALANFIRPVALVIVPVIIVYILILLDSDQKGIFQRIKSKFISIITITVAFLVLFLAITVPLGKIIGLPVWKSSSGYNLLVGTNYTSSGRYNTEDADILNEFNYNYDKVHSEAHKRAFNRITSSPLSFLNLVEKKNVILWGSNYYGIYWSTLKLEGKTGLSNFVLSHVSLFNILSHIHYVFLLLLAVIGCVYSYKRHVNKSLCIFVLFLVLFLSFTLLEVQSRYHYPAMPFIIVLSAYGLYEYPNFIKTVKNLLLNLM